MKKLLAVLLSLSLLFAVLTACSPKDDDEKDAPSNKNNGEGTLPYGGDGVGEDLNWDALP